VLPAAAAGIEREWPTVRQICRIKRWRQFKKNGEWQPPQHEVVHLISSLSAASPQALLASNRNQSRTSASMKMPHAAGRSPATGADRGRLLVPRSVPDEAKNSAE
jgi:hypothetical protein